MYNILQLRWSSYNTYSHDPLFFSKILWGGAIFGEGFIQTLFDKKLYYLYEIKIIRYI